VEQDLDRPARVVRLLLTKEIEQVLTHRWPLIACQLPDTQIACQIRLLAHGSQGSA
jgi:hypothetical protein